MTENRPYTFELAALLVAEQAAGSNDTASLRETATGNGVDLDQLDRAAAIVRSLAASGEDVDEWIRREYLVDGWLHGYLPTPVETLPADPALTTWVLSQHADAHYRTPHENQRTIRE